MAYTTIAMSKTYTVTIQESDTGRLTVTNVERLVRINQYRSDSKRISKSVFGFANQADPQTMTMTKRASRKTR
jgi:hypothetical protein